MKFLMFALLIASVTACDVNRRAVDSDASMNRNDDRVNDIQREEDETFEDEPRNRKSTGQSGASSSETDMNGNPATR